MFRLDIRSAMTDYETERLGFWARGRSVVEMGSLLGYSTVVMARVASSVVSVDLHNGYPSFGLPNDTEREFRQNLERYNVAKKVTVIIGDYRQASKWPADCALVDLDGSFDTTYDACLRSQARLVMVHDYQRVYCRGVAEAVAALERGGIMRVIDRAHTLIMMERKP